MTETAFEQQVSTLVNKGYPRVAGMSDSQFSKELGVMRDRFVPGDFIVIPENMVPLREQISLLKLNGKDACGLNPDEFRTVVWTPHVPYLLSYTRYNNTAMRKLSSGDIPLMIKMARWFTGMRAKLTLHEGVAIVTHDPTIIKNSCFSLDGSVRDSCGVATISQVSQDGHHNGGLRLGCYYYGSSQASS